MLLGWLEAECQEHGWQPVVRKATMREVYNQMLQLPLDWIPEYPDIPPF